MNLNSDSGLKVNTFPVFPEWVFSLPESVFKLSRMKSNALFLKPDYLFRYLRKGNVSQENYDASIKRSP